MKKELICINCGKSFLREIKQINQSLKRGYKPYCSIQCRGLSQIKSIIKKCDKCGKKISKTPSQFYKSKSGKHYCSQSCAISENNRGTRRCYKNGKHIYRKEALKYYGSKCRICGYDVEDILEVHHKDGNRENNEINNLDVLCPTHHNEYQFKIRRYV
jgi:hypothetical protein